MKIPSRSDLIVLLMLLCSTIITSQESQGEGIQLSGFLSTHIESYSVSGIEERRPAYSYLLSGNLALSYRDFSVPISFNYRDAQFSYDYTFNRYGISPTYKWATLHLGWRNMRFSPYTMSGRSFYGVGIELKPGLLSFSIMHGEVQNPLAIRDSLQFGASLIPIYDRKIMGTKLGFGNRKNKVEFIAMKVWDDENSFQYNESYNDTYSYLSFTPKENILGGINFSVSPTRSLRIYGNSGLSAITQDINDPTTDAVSGSIPDGIQDIIVLNTSSTISVAGDIGVNYFFKGTRLGLKWKRIGSFYTTLASNYFPNDLEQVSINFGTSLLNRKLSLSSDIGVEKNNLSGYRLNTTRRLIGNATLNFTTSSSYYANLRYANYQTDSETDIINLSDTLRFISTTQQLGFFTGYKINGQSRDLSFSGSIFYNTVTDQSTIERLGDIHILSLNGSTSLLLKDSGISIIPTIHYYRYTYDDIIQNRYGGGLKSSISLLDKKIKTSVSTTYSYNDYNDRNDGYSSNTTLNFTYQISQLGSISLLSTYRISDSILQENFTEWRNRMRFTQRI